MKELKNIKAFKEVTTNKHFTLKASKEVPHVNYNYTVKNNYNVFTYVNSVKDFLLSHTEELSKPIGSLERSLILFGAYGKQVRPNIINKKALPEVKDKFLYFSSESKESYYYDRLTEEYEKTRTTLDLLKLSTCFGITKLKYAYDNERRTVVKKIAENIDYVSNTGCDKKVEAMLNEAKALNYRIELLLQYRDKLYYMLQLATKLQQKAFKKPKTCATPNHVISMIIDTINYPTSFYKYSILDNNEKEVVVYRYDMQSIINYINSTIARVNNADYNGLYSDVINNDGVACCMEVMQLILYIYNRNYRLSDVIPYTRENNRKQKDPFGKVVYIEYCNKKGYDFVFSHMDRYLQRYGTTQSRNRIFVESLESYKDKEGKYIKNKSLCYSVKEQKQTLILYTMWELLQKKLKFSDTYLQIFLLHSQGYGYKSIGYLLNMSEKTVGSAIKRTNKKIQQRMLLDKKDKDFIDIHKVYNNAKRQFYKELKESKKA